MAEEEKTNAPMEKNWSFDRVSSEDGLSRVNVDDTLAIPAPRSRCNGCNVPCCTCITGKHGSYRERFGYFRGQHLHEMRHDRDCTTRNGGKVIMDKEKRNDFVELHGFSSNDAI